MGAVGGHEALTVVVDVAGAGAVGEFGGGDAHPVARAAAVAGGDEIGGPGAKPGGKPDQRGLPVDQREAVGIERRAARRAEGQRQDRRHTGGAGGQVIAGGTGERQQQRVIGRDGVEGFQSVVERVGMRVGKRVGKRFWGHDAL